MKEKEIQRFLWKKKENFMELIEEFDFPKEIEKPKVLDILPHELVYNNLIRFYRRVWEDIKNTKLIGCEVGLEKLGDSTIRTDFLGILEATNGIVIVELKRSKQTERQSFTELLAYESHIRTCFSPMNDSEIIYMLIAPMQERIVKEAVINTLLYKKQKIFVFQPVWNGNDLSTLKLRPWIPSFEEIESIVRSSFARCAFDVFKVTWEDIPGIQVFDEKGIFTSRYRSIMENLSSFTAQIMERKGIHGFVYTQRHFPELQLPLPNCLVIVGLNPYRATKLRLVNNSREIVTEETCKLLPRVKLSEILPGIRNKYWEFDESYDYELLELLEYAWVDELISLSFEILNSITKPNSRNLMTDYGTFRWDHFEVDLVENIMTYNFKVKPVGIIRDLYWEYLNIFYNKEREEEEIFEVWETDDIPSCLLDALNSDYIFFKFIENLVNPKWWEI